MTILFVVTALLLGYQETGPVKSPQFKIVDIGGKVTDLNFRVEDIGGKAQNLQVKETATEVRVEMAADILFDFDKAVLKPQAEAALRQVTTLIVAQRQGKVRVEGYTDNKGTDAYNDRLSLQRAESVRNWLVEKGQVAASRLTANGAGSKRPVAANTKPNGADDPEGRQRNRRVEVIISK